MRAALRVSIVALTPLLFGVAAFPNPWEALPPTVDEASMCIEGPLGDAECSAEAVERANSEQLHSILQELTNTTFFRLFRVNLHETCPFDRISAFDESPCAPVVPDAAASPGPFTKEDFLDMASGHGSGSCSIEAAHHHGLLRDDEDITTDLVDTTLSQAEGDLAENATPAACDDETLPEFWLDMCARIPTTRGELINLQLNPESDTGYNGSHIWAAIYQENCFVRASQPNSMCLEERVLYRILSGMHASTNIHAAMHHNASHSLHASAVAVFRKHFGHSNSQRLRDLHFAFVVLLRAVHKGSDYLRDRSFAISRAYEAEGERTGALVGRLLDSCILQSCASIFSAFDEAQLFQQPHEHTWWSLKRQFKGVFHNISSIVDCVSCQKCRLHGKLQLLGVGTALKWLLLPHDLIPSATTREEVVALINTLSKFSRAIAWSKQLAEQAWREDAAALAQAAHASDVAAAHGTGPERTVDEDEVLDRAFGVISAKARAGALSEAQETALLRRALQRDTALFSLLRHYGNDAGRHLSLLALTGQPDDSRSA